MKKTHFTGYCYTDYLLSHHFAFWVLTVIFEDREQFIYWEATCTVPECSEIFHKQTKKNPKKKHRKPLEPQDSIFASFLKSDLHHLDIIHFKHPLHLILCVIRKWISKKSTQVRRECKENSPEIKLSRDTCNSLLVILNCIMNHSAKSVWLT